MRLEITVMKIRVLFLFLLLLLLPELAEAQCSMCRAVLESDTDQSAAKGINNGILYLMAFPYLLIGGLGYFIYRSRKKAKKSEEA
ncbi:LPXTG-motif cell wall anchor domain-containing protein [Salegentibacter salegens]|uniref:LPXTG-motif cell wall anchor domain-containing protein n=2 Tax=Salegentibacter salegens TaxID=143223 RepID=A0A1M7MXE4_9FLAO|nr:LPXTG-motif cell wall-anchored protein [Salegentibacter salegens]SHM95757.1 LPXTG-motif cell wall anchor domain-containing protein [Salegentibacter salegens]